MFCLSEPNMSSLLSFLTWTREKNGTLSLTLFLHRFIPFSGSMFFLFRVSVCQQTARFPRQLCRTSNRRSKQRDVSTSAAAVPRAAGLCSSHGASSGGSSRAPWTTCLGRRTAVTPRGVVWMEEGGCLMRRHSAQRAWRLYPRSGIQDLLYGRPILQLEQEQTLKHNNNS